MKPFTDTINQLRYGKCADELTEQLAAVVKACQETGRAGSVSLKITITPGKSGQVEVSDAISAKLPELERGTSLFFITPDGNLSRTDPRQQAFPGMSRVPDPAPGEINTRADAA